MKAFGWMILGALVAYAVVVVPIILIFNPGPVVALVLGMASGYLGSMIAVAWAER